MKSFKNQVKISFKFFTIILYTILSFFIQNFKIMFSTYLAYREITIHNSLDPTQFG